MSRTFRCEHCGKILKRNQRIKRSQQYCSQPCCQEARKNAWRRDKNSRDADYRKKRHDSNNRWRKNHSAHLYQRLYREKHSEYVTKNREKQKKRNEKRKELHGSAKIVKSDALHAERLINPGLYSFSPCMENSEGKIVKSDAFMVQLSLIQSDTTISVQQMRGL